MHWTYDTYSNAQTVGKAIVKQGGDSWFFVTVDYAFGHAIEKDVSGVVTGAGGKVVGQVRHPLNSPDFSSYSCRRSSRRPRSSVWPMAAATRST